MKRLVAILAACALGGFAAAAIAGDFHTEGSLKCSDCHVAHGSQSHEYGPGDDPPIGTAAPYEHLLRNEVNDLCLVCHNNQSYAPDVFGANGGTAGLRRAGGLNAAPGHLANETGYEEGDGHSLWSTATGPGGDFSNPDGLNCTDCHAQHGHIDGQWRNLYSSGSPGNRFENKLVTYAIGTNDLTKDIYETGATEYFDANVWYNEPDQTKSAYGNWCKACHTDFHGSGGDANMGSASGGDAFLQFPWLRHPTADVNIGQNFTFVSNLGVYNSKVNRVKVMDPLGLWDGAPTTDQVTPSCFSCHRAHGTKNPFGLIFMKGDGVAPLTEEGDGTNLTEQCQQCHVQG